MELSCFRHFGNCLQRWHWRQCGKRNSQGSGRCGGIALPIPLSALSTSSSLDVLERALTSTIESNVKHGSEVTGVKIAYFHRRCLPKRPARRRGTQTARRPTCGWPRWPQRGRRGVLAPQAPPWRGTAPWCGRSAINPRPCIAPSAKFRITSLR